MKPSGYSLGTIFAGFILIGYLYFIDPTTAPAQLPLVLAAVAGLVGIFQKQAASDVKVEAVGVTAEAAKTAAKVATVESVKSKEVSRKNSDTLSSVVESVDLVHGIVNHQKDLVTAELAESRRTNEALTREIAGLHAALTATQVAPGSDVAAKLTDAIVVHPPGSPTPAADAAKKDLAQQPPTTKPIRMPPDQPPVGTGEHQ